MMKNMLTKKDLKQSIYDLDAKIQRVEHKIDKLKYELFGVSDEDVGNLAWEMREYKGIIKKIEEHIKLNIKI